MGVGMCWVQGCGHVFDCLYVGLFRTPLECQSIRTHVGYCVDITLSLTLLLGIALRWVRQHLT